MPTMAPDAVRATVLGALRDIMGEEPAAGQPLLAAGLDSLAAVELRNTLSRCGTGLGLRSGSGSGLGFRVRV